MLPINPISEIKESSKLKTDMENSDDFSDKQESDDAESDDAESDDAESDDAESDDEDSNTARSDIRVDLKEKHLINEDHEFKTNIYANTFCGKRLEALINGNNYDLKKQTFHVNPKFCNISVNKNTNETGNLIDEPGIAKLVDLFKRDYNYETGKFSATNKETDEETDEESEEEDINILSKAFTNEDNSNIRSLNKIKLKNYHKQKSCKPDGEFKKSRKGSSRIFRNYALQINKMIETNNKFKDELIEILQQVFVVDKNVSPHIVTLQPNLNEELLDKLINETRTILVKMYADCEREFVRTLKLYRKILIELPEVSIDKQIISYNKALP